MSDGKLKVYAEQCDQCLFGPNRIVRPGRMAEVLRECRRRDTYFICHKASNRDEEIVCRGFYDTQTCNLIRIMQRLDGIAFVPLPREEEAAP